MFRTVGLIRLAAALVVPVGVFYLTWHYVDTAWAMRASVGWGAGAFLADLALSRRLPGLLGLSVVQLFGQGTYAMVGGPVRWFLAMPLASMIFTGLLLWVSAEMGRPFLLRVLRDASPRLEAVLVEDQKVLLNLSRVWGSAYLYGGAISFGLLAVLPVSEFYWSHQVFCHLCEFAAFVGSIRLMGWSKAKRLLKTACCARSAASPTRRACGGPW